MELRHWWSFYHSRPPQERRRTGRTKGKQIARDQDCGDGPLFQYLVPSTNWLFGGLRVVLTHGDTANHEDREHWAKCVAIQSTRVWVLAYRGDVRTVRGYRRAR